MCYYCDWYEAIYGFLGTDVGPTAIIRSSYGDTVRYLPPVASERLLLY